MISPREDRSALEYAIRLRRKAATGVEKDSMSISPRKPQDKVYARRRGGGVKADRHRAQLPRSMQEFEPGQNRSRRRVPTCRSPLGLDRYASANGETLACKILLGPILRLIYSGRRGAHQLRRRYTCRQICCNTSGI